MPDTVLVLAPHPDDESIGCGGTICLHHERGDRVHVVFLTSGELGLKELPREQAWRIRESEAERAANILGAAKLTFLRQEDWFFGAHVSEAAAALRPILEIETPHMIYLPHAGEWHPDHQAALPTLVEAMNAHGLTGIQLRTYEVWTPLAEYGHVEDITSTMSRKLHAIRCYQSQLAQFRYDRAVKGLNQYRGCLAARCRYAEVFLDAAVESPTCGGPDRKSIGPCR